MVYVWGAPGSGKSYLLAAWAHACRVRGLSVDVTGSNAAQAVVADRVDAWDAAQQRAGFAAFNRVREAGGLWLAAGKAAPADLPVMPELQTRLGWGLVFQLHGLDDAENTRPRWLTASTPKPGIPAGDVPRGPDVICTENHTARATTSRSLLRVLEASSHSDTRNAPSNHAAAAAAIVYGRG